MSEEPVSETRYLVLGGSGFLGSYIVQELASRGESHVAVFDLKEPAPEDKVERVSYHTGDICDLKRLVDVLKEVCLHTMSETANFNMAPRQRPMSSFILSPRSMVYQTQYTNA